MSTPATAPDLRQDGDDRTHQIDVGVIELFSRVGRGLAAATAAFLESDLEAARKLVADDRVIDSLQAATEDLVEKELARLPETEAQLRRLVSVLRIVPELERSGDLVEHIALRTPQGLALVITPKARGLIQEMGGLGVRMWRVAAAAYVERDPDVVENLRRLDDELDDLHVQLSTELAATTSSMAVAIEMGLVARFYERLGDHAVNVARRLGYLWSAPSGEGPAVP